MVYQCVATDPRVEVRELVGRLEIQPGDIGHWMVFAQMLADTGREFTFSPEILRNITPDIVAVRKFDPDELGDSVVIQCAPILRIDIHSLLLRNAEVFRRRLMGEKAVWATKGLETIVDLAISKLSCALFPAQSTFVPALARITMSQSVDPP
jgi:hypothetical protein